MHLDRFRRGREQAWTELDALLARAHGKPERLGADGVRRLGTLYRGASADLALARRSFPLDPLVARLEALVSRARQVVYADELRRGSLTHFLSRGYWQRIAERPRLVLAAAALLFVPAVLALVWALNDPGAAIGAVPEQFRPAASPTADIHLPASGDAVFSASVFVNNIQVSFLAFAGGLAACIGTAFLLLDNGLTLGAVIGLAAGAGNSTAILQFVVAHGVLELSCIVVTSAAGLRVGWALVEPGPLPRRDALAAEARRAVEIVLGTIPWLVLAGLVEGFGSRSGLELGPAIAVGVGLGALFWGLVVVRGRVPHSRARDFDLR
ncbi:MAG: stage II sporulation protein M [Thermoleophilaceae bacterium]